MTMQSINCQRVGNGFLVIPQHSMEEPMVFITLLELLTYVAQYLGDMDTEFNTFEQQIQITEKVHTA